MENTFLFQQQVQLCQESMRLAEEAANRAVEHTRRCGSEGVQFNQDSIQARVEFEADLNRIKSEIESARAADVTTHAARFHEIESKYALDPHFMD